MFLFFKFDRRMIADIACLQKTKWTGKNARKTGGIGYKLGYCGLDNLDGVDIIAQPALK